MRLTSDQINKIKNSIGKYLTSFDLYLHGSRIDDQKTGGDIDLFLIVDDSILEEMLLKKHYILATMKMNLGDQRIDLNIISKTESMTNEFFLQSNKLQV